MKKNTSKIKGFTLVELLVVVVIISIMASLVIPRLTGQSERAIIGEAQQMLGAIKRAQAAYMDSTGNPALSFTYTVAAGNSSNSVPIQWSQLGFSPIGASKFDYSCNTGGCIATRVNGGTHTGKRIAINYSTGQFTCRGYRLLDATKGCTT